MHAALVASSLDEAIADLNELYSISEWVRCVETFAVWQHFTPFYGKSGSFKSGRKMTQLSNAESGMGLPLRGKVGFDADMHNNRA